MLKQLETMVEEAKTEEYSNPLAPSSYPQYGTELDVKYCSFYLKTGACRFGDRCSRHHMKPRSSDTILLPSMFQHISLGEDFTNDLDTDSCLEHEDVDTNKTFTEFFWDVFPEFQAVGQVTMFKVCCNHEPHLRGNVYVQYENEREAVKAYTKFNGRFYAGRQISCEFVKIEKWKSAICGQFHRNQCPKGKHCNFLHVFKNPGGLFMVHGSEVSAAPNRANLSAKGEHAVNKLDNHPVVQAARARQHVTTWQGHLPNNQSSISNTSPCNSSSPRRNHEDSSSPRRAQHSPPCLTKSEPRRHRWSAGSPASSDNLHRQDSDRNSYKHNDRKSHDKLRSSRQGKRSHRGRSRSPRGRSRSPRRRK